MKTNLKSNVKNMRKIVEQGYDKGNYLKIYREKTGFRTLEKRFFKNICGQVPKNSKILDLGCGPGIPYDKYLAERGFQVLGIDISKNI